MASGDARGPKALLLRLDRFQQRHRWAAFPYAVQRKYGDDHAGNLAALIAYYGFFSLFPLLLSLVTVLGFVLQGNEHLQQQVLDSALLQFPILGDQLRENIHSVQGNGIALAFGLAGTLYGGLRIANVAQNALNEVWDVPEVHRPGFLRSLLRSIGILAVVGTGILVSTALAGVAGAVSSLAGVSRVLLLAGAFVLTAAMFLLAFRLLTVADVAMRDLVPGALAGAVAWQVLQAAGGYYVSHQLQGASQTYGFFAVVIGLLSWMYLQAQVVLYAAEINVVRARRLWPRALLRDQGLTEADRRAFEAYARAEERVRPEEVDVGFADSQDVGFADGATRGDDTGEVG